MAAGVQAEVQGEVRGEVQGHVRVHMNSRAKCGAWVINGRGYLVVINDFG